MKKIKLIAILIVVALKGNAQDNHHPQKEEHLKRFQHILQKELQMNSEQQQKVELVFKDFMTKADKLHAENPPLPPPPPDPKLKAGMDKLAQERDTQIKMILSADQYKKYIEVEKVMRPPHPGGMHRQKPAL